MTDEKKPIYPVMVTWESFTPDRRQWKPSMPILKVNRMVQVDVPLDQKHFANADAIIVAQVSGGNPVDAILTPQGMRYIIDQIESVMSEKELKSEDFESENTEWEGETAKENPTTETQEEMTWEDETTDKETDTRIGNDLEWEN